MSRQVERSIAREGVKLSASHKIAETRKAAKRALLERQTEREKSDAYTGRSVASSISPSRSRVMTRKVKKGAAFGRILTTEEIGGREVSYHATKGWRSHRAA